MNANRELIPEFDPGLQTVRAVYEKSLIDLQWSVIDDRGFAWWGQDFRQRVWAEEIDFDLGFPVCKVCAVTDLLREVPFEQADIHQKIALLNATASTFALVPHEDERKVRLWSSVYVHHQNVEWVSRLLTAVAVIQPTFAQDRIDQYQGLIGGEPDITEHPESGRREDRDDILNVVERLYLPGGKGASRWFAPGLYGRLAGNLRGNRRLRVTHTETGILADLPFDPDGSGRSRPKLRNTLEVESSVRHPQFGSGVLTLLHLPELGLSESVSVSIANSLNQLEATTFARAHLLGAWCCRAGRISYAGFLPSFFVDVFGNDAAQLNIVQSLVVRSDWATKQLRSLRAVN